MFLLVTAAVAFLHIGNDFRAAAEAAAEVLRSGSDLKARELEVWLEALRARTTLVASNEFEQVYRRWSSNGFPEDDDRRWLRERLAQQVREQADARRIAVSDEAGQERLSVAKADPETPSDELLSTVKSLAGDGHPNRLLQPDTLVAGPGSALGIPVAFAAPERPDQPAAHVVMWVDAAHRLLPMLDGWPGQSVGARVVLAPVVGDAVAFLGDTGTGALADSNWERIFRIGLKDPGKVHEASEGTGPATLGIVRPVNGSGWHLVTTIGRDDVLRGTRDHAVDVYLLLTLITASALSIGLLAARGTAARRSLRRLSDRVAASQLEQRLGILFRSAPDIILVLTEDGEIVDANDMALAAYGYGQSDLLTLNIRQLRTAETRAQVAGQLAAAGTPAGATFVTEHLRRDGSSFPVEVNSRLFEHEGRRLRISVIRDITGRQRAEQALRYSEERFRTYFERSMVGMATTSLDKGWVDVNPALCEILGYPHEELVRLTWAELTYPDDLATDVAHFDRVLAAEIDGYEMDKRFVRKDGSIIDARIAAECVRDADGSVSYFVAIVEDITARKAAERELKRRYDELERVNHRLEEAQMQLLQSEKMASIGQLAAGVAHELNNPIGFVNSNLGALSQYLHEIFSVLAAYRAVEAELPPDLPGLRELYRVQRQTDIDFVQRDVAELVAESRDGLERVTRIVRDLKDFSRPGDPDWQWADLQRGLESTLNIVHNEIKYKAEVVREWQPLPPIYCLPSQLNQVFLNLLVNAAQAIDSRGLITIRTRATGNQVEVEVADTGRGIPPAHLGRIFDPFFTTKPAGKGTGLGLSLAYAIVERHHGEITVESTVGQGSRFRVVLPINPAVEGGQSDPASGATP